MERPVESWGADRVGDLTELVTAAMPAEALSADELLACCWDDPGVVLGHRRRLRCRRRAA